MSPVRLAFALNVRFKLANNFPFGFYALVSIEALCQFPVLLTSSTTIGVEYLPLDFISYNGRLQWI